MSMTVIGSLYSNSAAQNVNYKAKKKEVENNSKQAEATTQNSEVKKTQLSTAAQQLLERLQKTYNNMDFMVYGNGQDAKELLSQGTKEISVLFSSDELEKMASSEKYEKEYMDRVQGALRMSDEINKKFGFESAFGKDGTGSTVTKIGISFNLDGTTTFFAELEKSSASQREYIEKVREEKRTQRKEDAKEAEKKKQKERLKGKADHDVKRTTVQADSMEDLLEKIQKVDWNTIQTRNEPEAGRKFDLSV